MYNVQWLAIHDLSIKQFDLCSLSSGFNSAMVIHIDHINWMCWKFTSGHVEWELHTQRLHCQEAKSRDIYLLRIAS